MNPADMSLQELKEILNGSVTLAEEFTELLATDKRTGVRQLYQRLMRQRVLDQKENARLRTLELYEQDLLSQGYRLIAGIDEAGRGPLAGPVVAAAVVLPPGIRLYGLNDSKKVTPAKRAELFDEIKEKAVAWSLGIASVMVIDTINIYQATLKAMQEAVQKLTPIPDHLLVDAVKIPDLPVRQMALVRGDGLSASIAAASILAKVTRDRIMEDYGREYPQYGFAGHKGYGTAEHLEAIGKYGPCPIHRMSFNLGLES